MRPFAAQEIRGTYATLLLPIREDDSIDFDLLQEQLNFFTGAGVDGVYTNGTAGEFFSQSEDDFHRVSRMLADTCSQCKLPYQIGAASPTPQDALQRIAWAAEYAPSAIQVTLPDWWPPSLAECIRFLQRAAATAGDISLVLYNPPHAKRVLSPAELSAVLQEVPHVTGLKTGAGDSVWYGQMQPLLKSLSVFVPGHTLATGMRQGAAGSYSNVACLQPRGAALWGRRMLEDYDVSVQQQTAIQRFMTTAILPFREKHGFSNMALDKLLAWIGAWTPMPLRLRWPYLGIPEDRVAGLREKARADMAFLFED